MYRLMLSAIGVATLAIPVQSFAAVMYSQMPSSTVGGRFSDADFEIEQADDFTLTAAGTVQSVTWRGLYSFDNTPDLPMTFELSIYGDDANLPDAGSVLSSTTIQLNGAQVTNTGLAAGGFDVFEFTANVTPVALAAATRYWFSAVGNTSNDPNDNFYWTSGGTNEAAASRDNASGSFFGTDSGSFYFILNDTVVPEPASLALFGFAMLTLSRRRTNS